MSPATAFELPWAVGVGGSDFDRGTGIASDGSGGAYVAGSFEGTATFGNTTLTSVAGSDVFVARISSTGDFDWAIRMGGGWDAFGEGKRV